jgi:hypothetical protein
MTAPSGKTVEPGGYLPPVPISAVGTVASSPGVQAGSVAGSHVVPASSSDDPLQAEAMAPVIRNAAATATRNDGFLDMNPPVANQPGGLMQHPVRQ